MLHHSNTFTCPSCGEEKPISEAVICEDSEVINAVPIEETSRYVRYLQQKRLYKFRRCEKCNSQIETQKIISTVSRYLGIGLIAIGFFTTGWLSLIGGLLIAISLLVYFLWSSITKVYPHTTFEKAKECNALILFDS